MSMKKKHSFVISFLHFEFECGCLLVFFDLWMDFERNGIMKKKKKKKDEHSFNEESISQQKFRKMKSF
jgi:hypothetical protein